MRTLPERLHPTHLLTITVPLNMDDPLTDFSPVKDAIHICLSISRAAFADRICDDANVTIEETP